LCRESATGSRPGASRRNALLLARTMGRIARVLTALSGFSFERSGRLSRSERTARLDAEISPAEDSHQVRLGPAETPIVKKELAMSSGSTVLMDAAGRRRSPATLPGYLAGRAPHNKGMQYPPDPPRPEEIIVVMRQAGHDRHGLRLRALIAVLWRAGLGISKRSHSTRPTSTSPAGRC
jgi:hypothetical protein